MASPPARSHQFRNVLANYAGVFTTLAVHLLLVPVYVRLLGAEAYGLIGFFTVMQAVLQLLDLGLGISLNRELARRSGVPGAHVDSPSLVRSVEAIIWSMGALLGTGLFLLSPLLASHWLRSASLPPQEIEGAVALMGLALAFQWPQGIYNGGLLGLQRQGRASLITSITHVAFAVGAIGLLWFFPSLKTFFWWRSIASLVSVLVLRWQLWRSLPERDRATPPRVQWAVVRPIRNFSLTMTAISVVGMLILQFDKLLASSFMGLEQLGAYMLATTAATLIPQLAYPVFSATLPALTQAVARGDASAHRESFHLATRLLAALIIPITTSVGLFAGPLLLVWTGDATLSARTAPLLSMLALGALFNSLAFAPYAALLAAGWTRLALVVNLMTMAVGFPLGWLMARHGGTAGVAAVSPVLTMLSLSLYVGLTIPRLEPGTARAWLVRDTLPAASLSVLVVGLGRFVMPEALGRPASFLYVAAVTTVSLSACIATSQPLRARAGLLWSTLTRARGHEGS